MPVWNSEQYLRFEKERTKPARDLAGEISLSAPKKILDVGCGPGNSSAVLREKYPKAEILAIDSSAEMIEKARQSYKDIHFQVFNASDDLKELGTDFDIVFSNACIQWVENHEKLIPNLMGCLESGGVLAVQTPMNPEEPIHKIIQNLVKSEKWCKRIRNPRIFFNLSQNEYYDILQTCSSSFTLWQTTYFHVLDDHEAIMEWYKGTGLRPYLQELSPEEAKLFEEEVFGEVKRQYSIQKDGKVIFRFPRFFMMANK